MQMPADDVILLSMVNMKLRDGDITLSDLCAEQDWDEDALRARLAGQGYAYDEDACAFVYRG